MREDHVSGGGGDPCPYSKGGPAFPKFLGLLLTPGGTDVSGLTRGLVTLPSKVDPGAFSGQRQGWKTHKRTFWQCTV